MKYELLPLIYIDDKRIMACPYCGNQYGNFETAMYCLVECYNKNVLAMINDEITKYRIALVLAGESFGFDVNDFIEKTKDYILLNRRVADVNS